jgi:tryptophan 2,3-dioxygenase
LHLEKILNSQFPRSATYGQAEEHDETLFIIIHQVFELWFKLTCHELDFIIKTLRKKSNDEELCLVVERLQRLKEVWKVQVSHFPIIETLTPMDFMSFRSHLDPASGFDSGQFRMIETKFGVMEEKRSELCPVPGFIDKMEKEERKELEKMQNDKENNLFKALESWLARTPGLKKMPQEMFQKLPSPERCVDEHRMSHEAMMGAIVIHQYRFEPRFQIPYQILLLIKDLDGLFNKWRCKFNTFTD